MFVAQKLRSQSVSAYLIYMYQVEDLIRAYGLDAERIAAEYLPRFGYDEEQLKQALQQQLQPEPMCLWHNFYP